MKRFLCSALLAGVLALSACSQSDDETTSSTTSGQSTTTAASTVAASSPAAAAKPVGLDSSFGTNGILRSGMSASEQDRFMAVAFGQDGSFFAAGFVSQGGDQAMALAKFSPTGAPDKAFGRDGVATVNVAAGGKTAEIARSVAVQSTGKIIISGPVEHDPTAAGDAARDTDIAVVRFDAQGKLDLGFGKEGIARVDLGAGKATSATAFVGDTTWGLASLTGDKVVAFASKLTTAGGDRTDTDYVLVGLTATGALDSSFGSAGTVVVDVKSSADNPRGVYVQPDGKLLATGYSTVDDVVQPVLIRTSPTGALDTSFGTGGIATAKMLPGVAESYAAGLQGDAYISAGYGRGADATEKVDLIADRFKSDGSWDKSFGNEGLFRLDLAKEDDRARNVAVMRDGRILIVGSGKLTASNIDGLVVLLNKDGKPVSEFGTSGYILSDLGGPADSWYGVAVSPDGKTAIVVGYRGVDAGAGGNDDAVIARINV